MPELPEAEANRRRIEDECLNRTIEEAVPGEDVTYIDLPGDNERGRLVGRQFTETHRHGKLIFAGSKTGPWICVHLGMTGSLIPFDEGEEEPPSATKFLIRFEGSRTLAYRCPRKLGWLRVVDSPQAEIERIGFGPDAMAISRDDFVKIIGGTNGAVKSALIEQKKIAGVGNLWSDEILFKMGILPDSKASDLAASTLREMHGVMQDTLQSVVDTDADYSKLPDEWLISHRERGAKCRKCGGTIAKKTVGGRSAYYCGGHQS